MLDKAIEGFFKTFAQDPTLALLAIIIVATFYLIHKFGNRAINMFENQLTKVTGSLESVEKNIAALNTSFREHTARTDFRFDAHEQRIERLEGQK